MSASFFTSGRAGLLVSTLAVATLAAAPAGAARPDDGDPFAAPPVDLVAQAMADARPGPAPVAPARAAPPAGAFGGAAAVAADDLDSMRGGFLVAEGITFDLGAVVRTLVDGEVALSTTLNWTDQGPQAQHQAGAGATPATAEDLHAAAVLAGMDLTKLAGEDQVFLTQGGGAALVHRISGGNVQNIVVNTDNGVEIRQETQVNLTLPGFEQNQAAWAAGLLGFRLNSDLIGATAAAVGR